MISTIIFDLDFTLYDMRQVLNSSMINVITELSIKTGVDRDKIERCFHINIKQNGILHDRLFNSILEDLDMDLSLLKFCITKYHQHIPEKLEPYHGVEELLEKYQALNYHLILFTDGRYKTQRRKVEALQIERYFNSIVFTSLLSNPKPSAFQELIEQKNLAPHQCVMVGDHPIKDIAGAKKNGVKAVRVLQGEYKKMSNDENHLPDWQIENIEDIKLINL